MAPPKGKKVGGGPSLASMKAMMAAKKEAEMRQKQLEDEERQRQEEEARLAQEKLNQELAAIEAKNERERLKKEELRRQGKLLTKAEKDKNAKNQAKLAQMLANNPNMVIAGKKDGGEGEEEEPVGVKKKKPIYTKKKKFVHTQKPTNEQNSSRKGKDGDESSDVADDWENDFSGSEDEDSAENPATKSDAKVDGIAKKLSEQTMSEEKGGSNLVVDGTCETQLRSPICCILGHVDTGKTKLLDKIRQSNIQGGEAGGITQQIGATYFPVKVIREKTSHLADFDISVPGLLVIDTPGHESFTNLRSRGSSLCNIAILVVDIMHGLEPQTIESIGLLRQRKTPFIVALNKIDRIYGWKSDTGLSFPELLAGQDVNVRKEFEERVARTQVAFAEQGLNSELYFKNDDLRKCVSFVPTSAITGDGIPDMLKLLIHLTQTMMSKKLMYLSKLECTVLEVKVSEGFGTTIDVILSNGVLREGDRIAVCGLNGPIITNIRALLTPQPLKELRVKSQYQHNKVVKASMGCKICAPDLDKAVAGSSLFVVGEDDDEAEVGEQVMSDLTDMLQSVDQTGHGVCVQASTLGSLEALLSFLKASKIPVSSINIGPVHKKDVIRASAMLEQAKEYAVLLAFDVKVDREMQQIADEMDVQIFKADIIYHLFDQFTTYMNALLEQKRKDMAPQAVFPCVLRIVPGCVFNKRDPIILGVDVVEGVLRVGTPVCVPSQGNIGLGKVTSIELNHKHMNEVRKGGPGVAIKIEHASYETARTVGRSFQESDLIVSKISRASIDILKENFKNDMEKEDWALVVKLKKTFNIK